MALFRKRVTEIRKHLYEKNDNEAKSFRFVPDDEKIIERKIKYVRKHLKILTEQERVKEIPLCYGHLSVAHIKLKKYKEAKENCELQIESGTEQKDENMVRMAYSNLGLVHKKERRLKEAMECYEQSLELALKHKNKYAQGRLYNNMANIMEMRMEFDKAIEYHEKHLSISKTLNDRDALVKSCGALASMYHCLNDPSQAVHYLDMVIDQLRKNMKVLDTLADDADGSEPGGYVNIEEPDNDEDDDGDGGGGGGGGGGGSTGILAKIKGLFGK